MSDVLMLKRVKMKRHRALDILLHHEKAPQTFKIAVEDAVSEGEVRQSMDSGDRGPGDQSGSSERDLRHRSF